MTPRERVEQAWRFQEVRPTPYTFWYDHETGERLDRHYGGPDWRQRVQDHIVRLTLNWEPKTPLDGDRFRDIYGTIWQRGDPVHVVEPALREPTLRGFRVPSFAPYLRTCPSEDTGGRHTIIPLLSWADAQALLARSTPTAMTVVGYGYGLLESAWIVRGYENFFSDLLLEPAFSDELLDILLERHLELLDELVKLPSDGIIFSDDYGDQRGVIIGPTLWRQYIKPRLARLYARVHAAGKIAFQHTCGCVFDIVPDLIDIGLDVLQSLQPEAMAVYEIKRRYGRNIRLWGGLGTQHLLPFGTPQEIRAEAERLRRELGAGGGYVFTSSKPVMREVPIANAVAMLEATIGGSL